MLEVPFHDVGPLETRRIIQNKEKQGNFQTMSCVLTLVKKILMHRNFHRLGKFRKRRPICMGVIEKQKKTLYSVGAEDTEREYSEKCKKCVYVSSTFYF